MACIGSAKLVVHTMQQGDGVGLSLVKIEMQQDLYCNSLHFLETKNARIQQLEDIIRNEKNAQARQVEQMGEYDQVREELRAQYPELKNIIITHGKNLPASQDETAPATDTLIVYLEARKSISRTTQTRIRNWLKARFKLEHVYVVCKAV